MKAQHQLGLAALALSFLFLPLLSSCTIQEVPGTGIAVGPPAYAGGVPGGPIPAGCSFNSLELHGAPGQVFQVACPSGCAATGGLWGTDLYTGDSAICKAGIHAGAIPPEGGVLSVRLDVGQPAYRGSPRYGIVSNDYPAYGSSYSVAPASGPPPGYAAPPAGYAAAPASGYAAAPPPGYAAAPPQAIQAGCSFNRTQIDDALGTAHLVSCPPGCAATGGLWGTDVYTGDSSICKAAIHSGIITDGGGYVVVMLDGPQPAFRGSVRNQVTSNDYGSYASSYRLQPAR